MVDIALNLAEQLGRPLSREAATALLSWIQGDGLEKLGCNLIEFLRNLETHASLDSVKMYASLNCVGSIPIIPSSRLIVEGPMSWTYHSPIATIPDLKDLRVHILGDHHELKPNACPDATDIVTLFHNVLPVHKSRINIFLEAGLKMLAPPSSYLGQVDLASRHDLRYPHVHFHYVDIRNSILIYQELNLYLYLALDSIKHGLSRHRPHVERLLDFVETHTATLQPRLDNFTKWAEELFTVLKVNEALTQVSAQVRQLLKEELAKCMIESRRLLRDIKYDQLTDAIRDWVKWLTSSADIVLDTTALSSTVSAEDVLYSAPSLPIIMSVWEAIEGLFAGIFDTYLGARVLRNGLEDVLIYVGEVHAEKLRQLLSKLGFNSLAATSISFQCVNISNLPLFGG